MRVVVTGATGLVGRAVVADLIAHGDEAVVLSRNASRAQSSLPGIAAAHTWAPLQGPPPSDALAGADAVVHLLGESLLGRWTRRKKRAIYDTRVVSTRNLIAALEEQTPRPAILVSASAMGYYGSRGDEELTESSAAGQGFLADLCAEWEAEALKAEGLGLRVVRLRTSNVLASGGGMLTLMARLFRLGLGGPLGSGRQWLPWAHLADVAGAIRLALDGGLDGAVNVASPTPVSQAEFARTLGRVVHRPAILPAPAWALRLVLGEFAEEALASQRLVPQALLDADYPYRFTKLEPALRDALGA